MRGFPTLLPPGLRIRFRSNLPGHKRLKMYALFLVILGGGIGAGIRHGVNIGAAHWLGTDFPWGTFAINVLGSFLIGVVAAWFAFRNDAASQSLRLFLTTGI